jgi:hypothetical protein
MVKPKGHRKLLMSLLETGQAGRSGADFGGTIRNWAELGDLRILAKLCWHQPLGHKS